MKKQMKKLVRKMKKCKWTNTIITMVLFTAALICCSYLNRHYEYDKLIDESATVAHICKYDDELFVSGDNIALFADYCEHCGENMSETDGFIYRDNYCPTCDETKFGGLTYCSDCGTKLEEKERIKLSDTNMKTADVYVKVKIALIVCKILICYCSFYLLFEIPTIMSTISKTSKR